VLSSEAWPRPSLARRVVARHRGAEHEPTPDLTRLVARLRAHVEVRDKPEARLDAIRRRARLMLRRLADPAYEVEEMLAAFAWIVEVAEGRGPLPSAPTARARRGILRAPRAEPFSPVPERRHQTTKSGRNRHGPVDPKGSRVVDGT
jgi:hypothetical protein